MKEKEGRTGTWTDIDLSSSAASFRWSEVAEGSLMVFWNATERSKNG